MGKVGFSLRSPPDFFPVIHSQPTGLARLHPTSPLTSWASENWSPLPALSCLLQRPATLLGQSLMQIRFLSFKDFQRGLTLPAHPCPGHIHDTPSYLCCLYFMATLSEKLS